MMTEPSTSSNAASCPIRDDVPVKEWLRIVEQQPYEIDNVHDSAATFELVGAGPEFADRRVMCRSFDDHTFECDSGDFSGAPGDPDGAMNIEQGGTLSAPTSGSLRVLMTFFDADGETTCTLSVESDFSLG